MFAIPPMFCFFMPMLSIIKIRARRLTVKLRRFTVHREKSERLICHPIKGSPARKKIEMTKIATVREPKKRLVKYCLGVIGETKILACRALDLLSLSTIRIMLRSIDEMG